LATATREAHPVHVRRPTRSKSYGNAAPDVRYLLNSRCLSIAGGTEQILLTLAGKRLLGLPR
jgi:alkylation response protein AidB-like acyl-CoA dehydrogenase